MVEPNIAETPPVGGLAATDETGVRSSPAGPADTLGLPPPPLRSGSVLLATMRYNRNPLRVSLAELAAGGDTWRVKFFGVEDPVAVTWHPDHVKSLFTAKEDDVITVASEAAIRHLVGSDSVITSVGARHMRQRKLLLPAFHGETVQRYGQMIEDTARREIARWPIGKPFALAPRMQAVTLDVIMAGVFGIDTRPRRGTAEYKLRQSIRWVLRATATPLYPLLELVNTRRAEARGLLKAMWEPINRQLYTVIRERRAAGPATGSHDVLSMLLEARDDDGNLLTDRELRNELMSLLMAGHETTANTLAWALERLTRNPAAYDQLRQVVHGGSQEASSAYIDATLYEAMRTRPVVPIVARRVNRPWRLGPYGIPGGSTVAVNVIALHHRPDLYPQPHLFRPERFVSSKPGTYTLIPFGGGIRRCLGASVAMAESRIMLKAIATSVDLAADRPAAEAARLRNVTMIPSRGGRVVVKRRIN